MIYISPAVIGMLHCWLTTISNKMNCVLSSMGHDILCNHCIEQPYETIVEVKIKTFFRSIVFIVDMDSQINQILSGLDLDALSIWEWVAGHGTWSEPLGGVGVFSTANGDAVSCDFCFFLVLLPFSFPLSLVIFRLPLSPVPQQWAINAVL